MSEFESNSNKAKQQKEQEANQTSRRPEKAISGEASTRKTSAVSRFLGGLAKNETADMLEGRFMTGICDMICFAIDTIGDVIRNSISIRMTGEPLRRRDSSGRTNYRKYYDDRNSAKPEYSRPRSSYSYDDVIFETRSDAELVLDRMEEMLDQFKVVSVADLFDLAGVSSNYTDNKYGWTDLREAYVERARDGYVIRLPRAVNL